MKFDLQLFGQDRTALSQNVGTEYDLILTINGQVMQDMGLIESIDVKLKANLVETIPANNNGESVRRVTTHGFDLTFSMVRQDDSYDDLVDAIVAQYKNKGENYFFTGQATQYNNGTASQWQYLRGTLVPEGLGNNKSADRVDGLTFVIHFSSRVKIRGGSSAPSLTSSSGL